MFPWAYVRLLTWFGKDPATVESEPDDLISVPNIPWVSRPVSRVFIHASGVDRKDDSDAVERMRDYHVRVRGWRDIGYHYVITKDGTIHEGRPLSLIPAAQGRGGSVDGRSHNPGTIAVCVTGLRRFSGNQMRALRCLCLDILHRYNVTFHGHCEVSNKLCPVFDYAEVLGLDQDGFMLEGRDVPF